MNDRNDSPKYPEESKKIIIDTKVIDRITNVEVGQMLNYLKITGLELGYIINFKHPRLEWKRMVL